MNTDIADKIANAASLEDLLKIMQDDGDAEEGGELDFSSLPSFGGYPPEDTEWVWSWDRENLLVSSRHNGELEIVSREEWADA
jgi:hypothetical protein